MGFYAIEEPSGRGVGTWVSLAVLVLPLLLCLTSLTALLFLRQASRSMGGGIGRVTAVTAVGEDDQDEGLWHVAWDWDLVLYAWQAHGIGGGFRSVDMHFEKRCAVSVGEDCFFDCFLQPVGWYCALALACWINRVRHLNVMTILRGGVFCILRSHD